MPNPGALTGHDADDVAIVHGTSLGGRPSRSRLRDLRPHDRTAFNTLAKRLAPSLSLLLAGPRMGAYTRLAETYLAILQGKGSGTGWGLDTEVHAALSTIDNTEPLLFDVGAHRGSWSLQMRSYLPRARFVLFEPQPACQAAIVSHGVPEFTLVGRAVSSACGTGEMYTAGATAAIASLHRRRDSYFDSLEFSPLEIETVTIDSVVAERSIDTIDFLKLDIEGHELEALRGAAGSLAEGRIKALSFEFGSGNLNSRTYFRDFWDLLTESHFDLYRVLPSGRLSPIREYYEDCEHFRGVSNYVARRHD